MSYNRDWREILQLLNEVGAEFLVVGAYAVVYYTEPRYTKDLDIWINPNPTNATKVYEVLKKFGAPLADLTISDLSTPHITYQMGVEPNRIDILTKIDAVDFERAWANRQEFYYDTVTINLLGLDDLIQNKQACGRAQDEIDLVKLLGKKTVSKDK